jgi:hypothetical protein
MANAPASYRKQTADGSLLRGPQSRNDRDGLDDCVKNLAANRMDGFAAIPMITQLSQCVKAFVYLVLLGLN